MEEVQRERTTRQWHRYSDIPSFKDKPKQSGEYIVTEVTTKNEIKVSIRYYDVINDLWGYRSVSMTVIKCKKKAFKFCKFFDVS